ncbi:MAG TPA: hypothetical protein VHY82_12900 [Acetobacteraceae bacterium]|nr:hypothetical protein [Acetobacteraceae bacterium]
MSADMNPSMRENIETASADSKRQAGLTLLPAVNKSLKLRRGIAALQPLNFLYLPKRYRST